VTVPGGVHRLRDVLGPVLMAAVLLAAVEAALRLGGFEVKITSGTDPKANLIPLFHPATAPDGTPVFERGDAPVRFRRDKPANGLRVFVVGESSVFGFPFGPEFAFSRFLGDRLAAGLPDRTVEVVNAGVPAIGSWHVRRVVEEEIVGYHPDVVVIYTGHNDWVLPPPAPMSALRRALTRLRLYQLAVVAGARWHHWTRGPVDESRLARRDDPWGYARERARGALTITRREEAELTARYHDNLRASVRAAQQAGARVVVATLAQNLRDSPPGASRHRHGLRPATRAQWRTLVEDAVDRMRGGDWGGALGLLNRTRGLDSRPALGEYLRAQCLDRLGRLGEARAAYRHASDLDEIPLGARSAFNGVIARVAEETGAQLVDVPAGLAGASPHGLLGHELFFDHLHPTVAGHIAIARVLTPALGVPQAGFSWPNPDALLANRPDLRKVTVIATVALDMVLGWYDAALAEIDAVRSWYPEIGDARPGIERARRDDVVPSATDPPEAPD
jgi:lysophospholipase L1-like esterase